LVVAADIIAGSGPTVAHDLLCRVAQRTDVEVTPWYDEQPQRTWHARVAQSIDSVASSDPATLAREAHHWLAAGDGACALAAGATAAAAVSAVHAFPAAADLYERALAPWPKVSDPAKAAGIDEVDLLERAADAVREGYGGRYAVQLAGPGLSLVDVTAEPSVVSRY
jgi:hypothetical protein